MVQKQTMVTPSGIVTQPNEYGSLPPGTLRVGNNICIRKTGVIEPRPAFENFGSAIGGTNPFGVNRIWPLAADKILAQLGFTSAGNATGKFRIIYSDGTNSDVAGFGTNYQPGKTQITRSRDHTIIVANSAPQIVADSALGSTGGGTVTLKKAGLPMPAYIQIASGTAGSVLPDQMFIGYRAVFRRTDGGYTFQGAVSAAYVKQNLTGAGANPSLTIYWSKSDTPIAAGDLLEVYRTDAVDDIDLVGDRYRYAFSYTLTSSDITAGSTTIADTALATSADLYTNGAQEGSSFSNFMPPPSTDVVTFKAATFYNATASWHERSLRAKYVWGEMLGTDGRASGVGFVEKTVSYTTGTAVITASNVEGLTVGMRIESGDYPDPTVIASISGSGPYTITVDHNATATRVSVDRDFVDVIEINGVKIGANNAGDFAAGLALLNAAGTIPVIALPDKPLIGDTRFVTFTLLEPVSGSAAFTIRATHGDRYTPPLPEITATVETSTNDPRTNRLYFSKIEQPEAVGPASFLFVGHGTVLKMWATEQSLFVACTDGIFQITGDGDDWSVEPFNQDTILLTPDALDIMDNTAYAVTTAGFVQITEQGIEKISSSLIGDDIRALWKQFQGFTPALPFTWGIQVAADKYRNEVWINFNNVGSVGTPALVATYIWNTETNTFTTQSAESPIGVGYVPFLQSIVTGISVSTPAFGWQLRKYSDTNYMTSNFEFNPIFGEDVGYLKQWLDVTLLFELLQAVTIKPAFERVEYPAAYALSAGDNVEEVCAVLQDYAYNKHCRFGATITPILASKHWSLLGLAFRYRVASETLKA